MTFWSPGFPQEGHTAISWYYFSSVRLFSYVFPGLAVSCSGLCCHAFTRHKSQKQFIQFPFTRPEEVHSPPTGWRKTIPESHRQEMKWVLRFFSLNEKHSCWGSAQQQRRKKGKPTGGGNFSPQKYFGSVGISLVVGCSDCFLCESFPWFSSRECF